jgi:hypothetical protein
MSSKDRVQACDDYENDQTFNPITGRDITEESPIHGYVRGVCRSASKSSFFQQQQSRQRSRPKRRYYNMNNINYRRLRRQRPWYEEELSAAAIMTNANARYFTEQLADGSFLVSDALTGEIHLMR